MRLAPSAVGPFYCPADQTVYLDPTFFDELERKFGGSKAEFSQAYVIAHEVGHHVQNLLGYSDIVDQKRRTLPKEEFNQLVGPAGTAGRLPCRRLGALRPEKFNFIEPGDIESAIKSANAIGDDRLQQRAGGFTSPEKYTHGTSGTAREMVPPGLSDRRPEGAQENLRLAVRPTVTGGLRAQPWNRRQFISREQA